MAEEGAVAAAAEEWLWHINPCIYQAATMQSVAVSAGKGETGAITEVQGVGLAQQ